MKKLLLLIVLAFCLKTGIAQQLHFMSQYLQHNSMYNPAAAGMAHKSMVGASFRSMWASFPGNPKTVMLYGDVDWKKMNAGIGAYIYHDETGPTTRDGIQLAYSYHLKMKNPKNRLGLGIEARVLQFRIDKSKLVGALANDPVLAGADSKIKFDAGAGVYFSNDKLSLGVAVQQLIQSKIGLADVPNATSEGRLYRQYNAIGNYRFQTGDDIFVIPNFLIRVNPHAPTEWEGGVKMDYKDVIWWALNLRVHQFWSIQVGFKLLQRIRLSYSYDINVTPITEFSDGAGSHEVGLQFDLKK